MPSTVVRIKQGPSTYTVNVAVAGGQLVEFDGTTTKIKPSTAASVGILGVALYAAAPESSGAGTTTYGEPVQDMSVLQSEVAVAWTGEVKLKAAGAIAAGALVVGAANGEVVTAGGSPAVGTIVGRCVEPGGIASGALGMIRLLLG